MQARCFSVRLKINWALALILLLGVALRLSQYFACRSLWMDEASLALNFVNGSILQSLHPLQHLQVAPVGFKFAIACLVKFFGISEWALRFIPLVCGLLSLFVYVRLSQNFLHQAGLLFSTYCFCISDKLIYYSNEFKPYGVDVLLSMLLCLALLSWWDLPTRRSTLILAATGCVAIWFSLPIVIVMAGIGSVAGLTLLGRRDYGRFLQLLGIIAAWVVVFSCQYFLFARQDMQSNGPAMVTGWHKLGAFMPFPPWTNLEWFPSTFFGYSQTVLGLHQASYLIEFIFLCGVSDMLWRSDYFRLSLLLSPYLVGLAISALWIYPFQGRLALYTAPFGLIICGIGVDAMLRHIRPRYFCYALLGLALFSPSLWSIPELWSPISLEEVRPIATYLKQHAGPHDVVFLYDDQPALHYYAQTMGLSQELVAYNTDSPDSLARIHDQLASGKRCWLSVSHIKTFNQKSFFRPLYVVCRPQIVAQEENALLIALDPK